jgi:hypothetical protein
VSIRKKLFEVSNYQDLMLHSGTSVTAVSPSHILTVIAPLLATHLFPEARTFLGTMSRSREPGDRNQAGPGAPVSEGSQSHERDTHR